MHEMSVCQSILDIVLEQARTHEVSRIIKVNIRVGELRGIVPDHLSYYFDFLTKDTPAAGASLQVEIVPGQGRCRKCSALIQVADKGNYCPQCDSSEVELLSGLELQVKDIEVE